MAKKATGNFIQGFSSKNTGIRGTNVFSIGDLENFAVQTNMDDRVVRDIETNLNGFSQPITLDTLKVTQPVVQKLLDDNTNVFLNDDKSNVRNYAYYGSLAEYMRVAIEGILSAFPASLYISNEENVDIKLTVLNYTYDADANIAEFSVPTSCVINKYNLLYTQKTYLFASTGDIKDISTNFKNYSIWDFENEFNIVGFTGTTEPNSGYLRLQVSGNCFPIAANAGKQLVKFHIKPNYNAYESFVNGLNDFEAYLLNRDGNPKYQAIFKDIVQTDDGAPIFVDKIFIWKTTDGYNLDFNTAEYEQYLEDLMTLAHSYDDYKTNLISRFLTTGALKEFDTPDQKADKLLKIYGREFDEIKRFIDGLANVSKVSYNKKDNVPDTLVKNLAKTLGWGTFSTVNENDLMKSFLGEANSSVTFSGQTKNLTPAETDIELWRRLIINSARLFKAKGTRSCIDFLFKIIGAPESLIDFNEYVYLVDGKIDVKSVFNSPDLNFPFDEEGFPVIPSAQTSDNYFQMKGGWRTTIPLAPSNEKNLISAVGTHTGDYDNGKLYFDQFAKFDDKKGFTLNRTVDNVKSWTLESSASTRLNLDRETNYDILNSRLVMNTKEVDIFLDPAKAIEYDVYNYNVKNGLPINPDSLNYPYPDTVLTRADVSNMSFVQYTDFVYSNFINAKNRKVATDNFGGGYPTMEMIYFDYYYAGQNYYQSVFTQEFNNSFGSDGSGSVFLNVFDGEFLEDVAPSNQLDYQKIQTYIRQIDGFWVSLLEQFVPSTTIWQGGTKYRNTIFERQKYVYKHGINDGSEFKTEQPTSPDISVKIVAVKGRVSNSYVADINNTVKVDKSFNSSISFPEPGDSGTTAPSNNHLRIRPWITGNTMIFIEPSYYMQQVAKIASGQTEPVRHNISVSAKTISVTFTGGTASMLTNNPKTKFRYRVYPYDYPLGEFVQTPVYTKLTDNDFSGQTGNLVLTDVVPNTFTDGDYLVKGSFLTTGDTTTQFGYNFNQPYIIDTEGFNSYPYYTYGLYEPTKDYWFTIVSNPNTPQIDDDIYDVSYQPTNSGLTLVNANISYSGNSVTAVTYNELPLGDPILSLNGNAMYESTNSGLTDGDYFIFMPSLGTSMKIIMRDGLYASKGDTLNIIYLKSTSNSSATIASDSQLIYAIPSGATDAAQGSKIYYNTSSNKFEYYVNFLIGQEVSFDDLVIQLNGNTLQKGTDYIKSSTNKTKIIFMGSILVGDTILIFYPTQDLTKYLYLNDKNLTVAWAAVTDTVPGLFTVQVADSADVNFTSVLYSATTPYQLFGVPTNHTYSLLAGVITEPNKTFILRVKSDKYFTNMLGEIITTTSYSEVLTFKTDNRVLS